MTEYRARTKAKWRAIARARQKAIIGSRTFVRPRKDVVLKRFMAGDSILKLAHAYSVSRLVMEEVLRRNFRPKAKQ